MPAPPGNKNALKHGLYSKRITPAQSAILGEVQPLDVEHEISILRAVIDNILGEIETAEEIEQKARLYNSLFTGIVSLNSTIRTHALLSGKDTELEKQIEEGKIFARQRLNVYHYLTPPPPAGTPPAGRGTEQKSKPARKKGGRAAGGSG